MKASFKLLKRSDKYELIISVVEGKKRSKKKITDLVPFDWDVDNENLLKSHPDYKYIIADFLNTKAKIKRVNLGNYSYNEACGFLFGDTGLDTAVFKDLVKPYLDRSKTGKLYVTVINSFEAVNPGIKINKITPEIAKAYMNTLLKTNKPNGVHTYMRTLTALFNKVSGKTNPFTGIRPKKERTASKHLSDIELKTLFFTRSLRFGQTCEANLKYNFNRFYYMLLFYLGGIDMIDLSHLRYDEHVRDGRVQFTRFKGGTNAFINNKIFPEAKELLDYFDCYPYLVPIYKYKGYKAFVDRMNRNINNQIEDLEIKTRILTKGARYSFINRAQQLLIDERITMELVGHVQQSTHSIYTNEFPLQVRDQAHKKIITL